MKTITEEKYACRECWEERNLVMVRGRASICEECYNRKLTKRRQIRKLNKFISEMM